MTKYGPRAAYLSRVLRVARHRLDPRKRVSVLFTGTGAALAPFPDDDHALLRAAVEAVQAGNYDWAIAAFSEALIRNPSEMNQVISLGDRGRTYLNVRKFNAAIADFEDPPLQLGELLGTETEIALFEEKSDRPLGNRMSRAMWRDVATTAATHSPA